MFYSKAVFAILACKYMWYWFICFPLKLTFHHSCNKDSVRKLIITSHCIMECNCPYVHAFYLRQVEFIRGKCWILWPVPLMCIILHSTTLSGYMVSYRLRDSSTTVNSTQLPETQLHYTVATLRREEYYMFSVTAKTTGWGAPANALVYTMINRRKYKNLPNIILTTELIEIFNTKCLASIPMLLLQYWSSREMVL